METIKLSSRTKNNGNPKLITNGDKIPGIFYGKNIKPQQVSIDSKTIKTLVKDKGFYSKILSVELNGVKEKVLPKEVQFHPVTDNIIHVDFMSVQENTKVTVEVPVNFLNRDASPGIKQGGVLNVVRRTIELRCNAGNIPAILECDLINLEIGDSIKISNILLPEGVQPTITGRDFVIATLVPPTVEAEPEKTEGEEVDGEEKVAVEGSDEKEAAPEKKQESSETKTDKIDKKDKKDKKE